MGSGLPQGTPHHHTTPTPHHNMDRAERRRGFLVFFLILCFQSVFREFSKGIMPAKPVLEHFAWQRVIIDEGHEYVEDKYFAEGVWWCGVWNGGGRSKVEGRVCGVVLMCVVVTFECISAKYYWYVTGTPFPTRYLTTPALHSLHHNTHTVCSEVMDGVLKFFHFPEVNRYNKYLSLPSLPSPFAVMCGVTQCLGGRSWTFSSTTFAGETPRYLPLLSSPLLSPFPSPFTSHSPLPSLPPFPSRYPSLFSFPLTSHHTG